MEKLEALELFVLIKVVLCFFRFNFDLICLTLIYGNDCIINEWKVSVVGVFLVRAFPQLLRKSLYSVRMRENADQKSFKYVHFLYSAFCNLST